ncbi:methyltransferase family protein, partial [Staphylococcus capitis]|uniref:methyltransferase family protein n=1 Tax=Staphylococcus capitis TaxID=29388 RepID=UPI003CFD7E9E
MTTTATPAPDSTAAPEAAMRLREIAFGAARAAAVRAAARLRVADALGEEPTSIGELAATVDAEPDPLCRLP